MLLVVPIITPTTVITNSLGVKYSIYPSDNVRIDNVRNKNQSKYDKIREIIEHKQLNIGPLASTSSCEATREMHPDTK